MQLVHIIINSCQRYYATTVPPLLQSLQAAGVPMSVVHVVIGECEKDDDEKTRDGYQLHYVQYANLDNNALLWACQNKHILSNQAHWLFYLHDTCLVTPEFWQRVLTKATELHDTDMLAGKMHGPYSMCIGLYRTVVFFEQHISNSLTALINYETSPEKILSIKSNLHMLEDYVFTLVAGLNRLYVYPNVCEVIGHDTDNYQSGIERRHEYYADPGVIKMKANWGVAPLHLNL